MKKFTVLMISILSILVMANLAFSIPAMRDLKDFTMPDGTIVKARHIGDEFMSWFETEDGYTLLRNRDGYFEYAVHDTGKALISSGILIGDTPPPVRKHLRPSLDIIEARRAKMSVTAVKRAPQKVTIIGIEQVVVLLIRYTDIAFSTSPLHDVSYFDTLYFGNSLGNLSHYLKEISYNKLDITGTSIGGLTASGPKANYGVGPSLNDFSGARALVLEAVQQADASFDFSPYDKDLDGYVDHLVVVHAGPDAAASSDPDDIWSHRWALSSPYTTNDLNSNSVNVKISAYIMNSEDPLVGIHAHEFLHDLGVPDLYDYDYDGNPVSDWCIMDYGAYGGTPQGSVPTQLCGYLKYDLDADAANGNNGWLSSLSTVTAGGTYSVFQLYNTSGTRLVKVPVTGTNEYFLVENRQAVGYDASLPETGIVIYHVDEGMPDGSGYLNDGTPSNSYYRITVEDPGGTTDKTDAAYSSGDGQTAFNGASTPNSNLNGGVSTGISIDGIGTSQAAMPVTISFNAPSVSVSASPTTGDTPLTVTFTGTATAVLPAIIDPASYSYDFGDTNSSTEQNPTHTFNNANLYTVTFTATDDNGMSASATVDVIATVPSTGGSGRSSGGGGGGCFIATASYEDTKELTFIDAVIDVIRP